MRRSLARRVATPGFAPAALWALASAAVIAVLLPTAATAHGLVGRSDLPLPDWLFAWGSSIILIVSFVALSVAWRKPRLEGAHWRPLGAGLSRVLTGPSSQVLCGLVGVFLLVGVQEILGSIEGIAFVRFTHEDVVRHKLVQRIVEAYKQHAEETGTQRRR